MTLQQVNRYTKAPISGKRILCPNCERISIVYHFSWCAIKCQHCNQFINKEDFLAYPSNIEKRKINISKAKLASLMSDNLGVTVKRNDIKIEEKWLFHNNKDFNSVDCYAFDLNFNYPIECWDEIPFRKSAFHLGKTEPDTLKSLNNQYCKYLQSIGQESMCDEFKYC